MFGGRAGFCSVEERWRTKEEIDNHEKNPRAQRGEGISDKFSWLYEKRAAIYKISGFKGKLKTLSMTASTPLLPVVGSSKEHLGFPIVFSWFTTEEDPGGARLKVLHIGVLCLETFIDQVLSCGIESLHNYSAYCHSELSIAQSFGGVRNIMSGPVARPKLGVLKFEPLITYDKPSGEIRGGKVIDFNWSISDPWKIASVSTDSGCNPDGSLHIWCMSDLIHIPTEEVHVELNQFKNHISSCG
ncbi:uncharacterized protein A4U43_C07F12660 [Asparagus officinalis]|uniref:Uncharacterized protein n=1 Tax=Asparagus officinalis TaxID=4686 RepID=A0A5P1EBS3_ASPOF|nr:uncharacterized protein A4U43_C07F12660 [Asparagus officinalis]